MLQLDVHSRGVIVPVRAHAGARRNKIVGIREGMLRVSVTAAPERGKANQAIIGVLSEFFGVPKSAVELVTGDKSSRKRFLIVAANADYLRVVVERMNRDV